MPIQKTAFLNLSDTLRAPFALSLKPPCTKGKRDIIRFNPLSLITLSREREVRLLKQSVRPQEAPSKEAQRTKAFLKRLVGERPLFVAYLWGKPPAQGRDTGASERKNGLCPLSNTPLRYNPPLFPRNGRTFPGPPPEVEGLVKTHVNPPQADGAFKNHNNCSKNSMSERWGELTFFLLFHPTVAESPFPPQGIIKHFRFRDISPAHFSDNHLGNSVPSPYGE